MKVAIHQPNYLPWIGYFKKMALADTFVLLDTVQFSKDSYTQRTRIRTKESWMWLTIPIEKDYHFKPIKDVRMPRDGKWQKKHMMAIVANYAKTPGYDGEFIDGYFGRSHDTLRSFNEYGIFYIKRRLGLGAEVVRASELNISPGLRSTDLIVDIVRKAGGDTYISGSGGDKYQDKSKFNAHNIGLEYARFSPAGYGQRWEGFEPYMSAIDLLFNLGEEGADEIKNARATVTSEEAK